MLLLCFTSLQKNDIEGVAVAPDEKAIAVNCVVVSMKPGIKKPGRHVDYAMLSKSMKEAV